MTKDQVKMILQTFRESQSATADDFLSQLKRIADALEALAAK